MTFDIPILLIVYNRPELATRVFKEIAKVRPSRLFVAADGPSSPEFVDVCFESRAIVERVDWPCDIAIRFSDDHLGCRKTVVTAIDWVLSQESEVIILEDDCLPSRGFFKFCQELLSKFKNDEQVMHISGVNLAPSQASGDESDYFFSRFCLPPWGWATWRRAWRHFNMEPFEKDFQNKLIKRFVSAHNLDLWIDVFERNRMQRATWDLQWNFSLWRRNGLAIIPHCNLISNLGFGEDASLTRNTMSSFARMPTGTINLPLKHPNSKQIILDNVLEDCLTELISEVLSTSSQSDISGKAQVINDGKLSRKDKLTKNILV